MQAQTSCTEITVAANLWGRGWGRVGGLSLHRTSCSAPSLSVTLLSEPVHLKPHLIDKNLCLLRSHPPLESHQRGPAAVWGYVGVGSLGGDLPQVVRAGREGVDSRTDMKYGEESAWNPKVLVLLKLQARVGDSKGPTEDPISSRVQLSM